MMNNDQHSRDKCVDRHRNLEVQGFFALLIYEWVVIPFDQPHDQRREDVCQGHTRQRNKRGQVTEHSPHVNVFVNNLGPRRGCRRAGVRFRVRRRQSRTAMGAEPGFS